MKFLFLLIAAVYSLQPSAAVCPEDQSVEVLLAEILSAECMDGFARVTANPSSSDEHLEGVQQLCVEQCINNITNHFRTICNDTLLAIDHENACLLSNNASIGQTCSGVQTPTGDFTALFTRAVGCFSFPFAGTCADSCRQGLMAISARFDCCYQHLFNNTAYLDALIEGNRLDQQGLTFFRLIGNASLWEECNVPRVGTCVHVSMATQGAVRAIGTLATSITAAFIAAAITLILSAV